MICKNCGQEIPQGDAFCQNCGQPVNAGTAEEKSITEPAVTEIRNSEESSQQYYDTQGSDTQRNDSQGNDSQGSDSYENDTQGSDFQNDNLQNNFEQEFSTQNYNTQESFQSYNNTTQSYNSQSYDQPYTANPAAAQQENPKKKLNPSVIGLAAVVILAVLFLKSCFFGSTYKTPIDDIVKIVNKKQTNIDKIVDAMVPAMLSDTYEEIIDILESNKEYKKDFKKLYDKTLPDALEDGYDEFYDNLEDQYGKNIKLSYKIEDKKKLDKDEREAIASAYSSFAVLSSGITDCIEALEGCTELKEKEIKKLVKQVEALEKKLDKFKVSSGYVLDVEFTIKGKEDKTSQNVDIVVIKANGDWMIDYLSTIMLNSKAYDLDEMDKITDELDLKQLNSELKIMARYLNQIDKDMVEDALDNWEDIMDFVY